MTTRQQIKAAAADYADTLTRLTRDRDRARDTLCSALIAGRISGLTSEDMARIVGVSAQRIRHLIAQSDTA